MTGKKHTRKPDHRPSMQFYPGDWLREQGLRMCDLAARGLWIELLSHMFFLTHRGELRDVDGRPFTLQELASLVGRPEEEVKQALKQLLKYHVAETHEDGAIYSRRMYRDEKLRQSKAEAGRKGGRKKPQAKRGSSSSSSASPSASTPSVGSHEKTEAPTQQADGSGAAPAVPSGRSAPPHNQPKKTAPPMLPPGGLQPGQALRPRPDGTWEVVETETPAPTQQEPPMSTDPDGDQEVSTDEQPEGAGPPEEQPVRRPPPRRPKQGERIQWVGFTETWEICDSQGTLIRNGLQMSFEDAIMRWGIDYVFVEKPSG